MFSSMSDLRDAHLGRFPVCLYISVSLWWTHIQVSVTVNEFLFFSKSFLLLDTLTYCRFLLPHFGYIGYRYVCIPLRNGTGLTILSVSLQKSSSCHRKLLFGWCDVGYSFYIEWPSDSFRFTRLSSPVSHYLSLASSSDQTLFKTFPLCFLLSDQHQTSSFVIELT